jgi:predicted Fe-Mo cluster-binding NifX family protein
MMRIAIPTKGDKGIEDIVSDVFGRSVTFTVIDIGDGSIRNVIVVKNPAASYKHGAGPIIVKMLADMEVTAVAAREFGLGASTLLDQNNIKKFEVKAEIPVREAVETVLKNLAI